MVSLKSHREEHSMDVEHHEVQEPDDRDRFASLPDVRMLHVSDEELQKGTKRSRSESGAAQGDAVVSKKPKTSEATNINLKQQVADQPSQSTKIDETGKGVQRGATNSDPSTYTGKATDSERRIPEDPKQSNQLRGKKPRTQPALGNFMKVATEVFANMVESPGSRATPETDVDGKRRVFAVDVEARLVDNNPSAPGVPQWEMRYMGTPANVAAAKRHSIASIVDGQWHARPKGHAGWSWVLELSDTTNATSLKAAARENIARSIFINRFDGHDV